MGNPNQKIPEDYFERIVTEDLKRVFDIPSLKPRALFLCMIVDFWLGQLIFSPLIIAVFRGSWNVRNQMLDSSEELKQCLKYLNNLT